MNNMFNVCQQCGAYDAAKKIHLPVNPALNRWAHAKCPHCGYMQRFKQLPLFIVCGASGTGKTAVCLELSQKTLSFIPLEGDILWSPAFNKPEDHYREFFDIWLRMAKNIGQSGRPVVLFNAGAGVTGNLQNCIEYRYFSTIHYLALVCDASKIEERLTSRPVWRNVNESFIQSQKELNNWYRDKGPGLDPPITILDTSNISISQTAASVSKWIETYRSKHIFA